MRLSEMFEKQGIKRQTITKALEAELPGLTLADKELSVIEKGDLDFDIGILEGEDVIIYSHSLTSAYRLKKASIKTIDQLAAVIPGMVVIVYKE